MESEGLYRYEHRDEQKAFVVVGPGRENMGGTYTKNEASIAARLANLAYAEGRKAERERCLAIANRHPNECDGLILEDCLQTIKDEIGGQDGK
jgi:hypothetical protein